MLNKKVTCLFKKNPLYKNYSTCLIIHLLKKLRSFFASKYPNIATIIELMLAKNKSCIVSLNADKPSKGTNVNESRVLDILLPTTKLSTVNSKNSHNTATAIEKQKTKIEIKIGLSFNVLFGFWLAVFNTEKPIIAIKNPDVVCKTSSHQLIFTKNSAISPKN